MCAREVGWGYVMVGTVSQAVMVARSGWKVLRTWACSSFEAERSSSQDCL